MNLKPGQMAYEGLKLYLLKPDGNWVQVGAMNSIEFTHAVALCWNEVFEANEAEEAQP